jgi:hypothetical protein
LTNAMVCLIVHPLMVSDVTLKLKQVRLSSTDIARLSIPARLAELFLERLVNLEPGDERKQRQFCERFPGLLPTLAPGRPPEEPDITQSGNLYWFLWDVARPALRTLWAKPATLAKEIDLMLLAGTYMAECGRPPVLENSNVWEADLAKDWIPKQAWQDRAIYPTGRAGPATSLCFSCMRSKTLTA